MHQKCKNVQYKLLIIFRTLGYQHCRKLMQKAVTPIPLQGITVDAEDMKLSVFLLIGVKEEEKKKFIFHK